MAEYQQFDNEESLREAKRRLPLNRLMEQHGDTPPPIGMKWGACPICKKKTTARLTDSGAQLFFKCANDTCPSATAGEGNAWTELHYLAFKTGYTGRDVFVAYLKETNVWKDVERYKSNVASSAKPAEQTPPPQNLGCGESSLAAPVPPASEPEPASMPPIPSMPAPESASADEGENEDEEMIQNCIEVILAESRASVSLLQRRLRLGYGRANRIMGELERRGVVGPAKGAEPRDVLLQRVDAPKSEAQLLEEDVAKFVDHIKRLEKWKFNFSDLELIFGFARGRQVFDAALRACVISPLNNEGDLELTPKPAPTVQFVSSNNDRPKTAAVGKIDGEEGYAALHDFFTQLNLSPQDEELLFRKRGLKSSTSAALRFRSNPRSNRGRLLEMHKRISKEELLDSGLYVRVKGKHAEIKPNSQFCGAGMIRKLKEGERVERNQWKDNDGNLWGWCEPVLIPYFDELGRLIGLRPHKGGGHANTVTGSPRVYIPREPREDGKAIPEIFPKVVITEGEFKAAALYQTVGAGRIDGLEPYGVVAVPGIWFGQNYAIREELDQWLRDVRCRVVKVAYDNEEKGNPTLESFKTDPRKRFDAEIMARVIATDIANKLHVRGEVCRLPDTWRNDKGKADWDGALVQLTQPNQ